ncbi:lipase (class 3) [Lentzea atacamensis]|uniref:Lipase (Class 3) n=1 Tax=Lentzea atacamensis TaxID=531938 RepID=A0A316HUB4_9PSEU|nr:alpha/beta hydrolase [Lentzea atacamensis]PWK84797.1 lipase (class 3) [Lentzea atacamensis]
MRDEPVAPGGPAGREVDIAPVSDIQISGGAGGFRAKGEDLVAMSVLTGEVADDTLKTAMAGHKFLVEPDVLASALLNPSGVAKFEAAMAMALDGPNGLTATSAAIGLRGDALRATKLAYEAADELAARGLDASRWMAGLAVASAPGGAVAAGLATGTAIAADVYANYDGDWQKWLVDHPGMVDTLIGMSPGMLSSLGVPVDLASTLDLLAATYADGKADVTDFDPTPDPGPHNLRDILLGLDERNDPYDENDPSNLDVRIIKDANGNPTGYIVDIPGTKDWNAPWDPKSANDSGVNIDAMAGNNTVLQQGIEEALRKAGAQGTGVPVMLVGHSQGGIVAAQSTNDLISSGYNVTHVVTAGSPVGRIDIPDNVQMLSLENKNDIVPRLDASDNPNTANRTTVTFENQTGTIGGNHGIGGYRYDPDHPDRPRVDGNYVAVAGQLDKSSDPSVRRFLDSTDAFTQGSGLESQKVRHRVAREGVN